MVLKSSLILLSLIYHCHGTCLLPCTLSWEGATLAFPSNAVRKLYLDSGKYIPKNIIATKAVIQLEKMILLCSRTKRGVPATILSYDQVCRKRGYPKFEPFPNLEMHEEGNCRAIQNAVDIFLDRMGLLWVLDSGIVNTMESPSQFCSPKVLCISPSNGRVVRTIDLSNLTVRNVSKVQNVVADYDMQRVFLYISDPETKSILVYDVENAKGFRVILPSEVAPLIVSPQDVLYLALIKKPTLPSQLFFTYLSKPGVFSINTQFLKTGDTDGRIRVAGQSSRPIVFLGTSTYSRIFFRYLNESSVNVWDATRPFDFKPFKPIYKSPDCFLPTAVILDNFNCFKILESNFYDYIDGSVGSGVIQQLNNIITDPSKSIIKQ